MENLGVTGSHRCSAWKIRNIQFSQDLAANLDFAKKSVKLCLSFQRFDGFDIAHDNVFLPLPSCFF